MEKNKSYYFSSNQPQSLVALLKKDFNGFFAMDNVDFIKIIQRCIPESLLLKGEANSTVEGIHPTLIKENFLGVTAVEEIRAFAGLLRFKEVVCGLKSDYDQFVDCQIELQKPVLSFAAFIDMQSYVKSVLKTPEAYAAAIWSILCNDLGKLHSIIELYNQNLQNDYDDHDLILAQLLTQKPELFPGFQMLPIQARKCIIAGYASRCDISQFQQLELPQVALQGLKALDPTALELYILHSIFDVAGAAAHIKFNGSLTMHAETWQFFNAVCQCLVKLPHASIDEVYNEYLAFRGRCIGIANNTAEQVALIRIAGMTRLATVDQGKELLEAWQSLRKELKTILINELNLPGSEHQPALFINYGVALLLNTQSALLKELQASAKQRATEVSQEDKRHARLQGFAIGLTHFAKILNRVRKTLQCSESKPIVYVECQAIAKFLGQAPHKALALHLEITQQNDNHFEINFLTPQPTSLLHPRF